MQGYRGPGKITYNSTKFTEHVQRYMVSVHVFQINFEGCAKLSKLQIICQAFNQICSASGTDKGFSGAIVRYRPRGSPSLN